MAAPGVEPGVAPGLLEKLLQRPWWRRAILGLAAAAPVLAVVCLAMALTLRQPRVAGRNQFENFPTLNALWSQLIRKDMRTDIVVTDSSLGLIQDLIQRPIPLAEYVHPDQWGQAESLSSKPDVQAAGACMSGVP